MTVRSPNPFALLIDADAVLAACAASPALGALPTHAHHRADLPSASVSDDVAEFDAAIDALATKSPHAIRKSARSRTRASRSKQRGTPLAAHQACDAGVAHRKPVGQTAPMPAAEVHRAVAGGIEPGSVSPSQADTAPKEAERPNWWAAPYSLYWHQLRLMGLA